MNRVAKDPERVEIISVATETDRAGESAPWTEAEGWELIKNFIFKKRKNLYKYNKITTHSVAEYSGWAGRQKMCNLAVRL